MSNQHSLSNASTMFLSYEFHKLLKKIVAGMYGEGANDTDSMSYATTLKTKTVEHPSI